MSSPASSPSLRRIPPLSYTIQNIFFSISTVLAAYTSLGLTLFLVLPMSLARLVLLFTRDAYLYQQRQQQQPHEKPKRKKKVVLVVGATHGIGLNIIKQYANAEDDSNVSVIAVGRSKGLSFSLFYRAYTRPGGPLTCVLHAQMNSPSSRAISMHFSRRQPMSNFTLSVSISAGTPKPSLKMFPAGTGSTALSHTYMQPAVFHPSRTKRPGAW